MTDDFEWLNADMQLEDDNFDWLSDDYEIQTTRTLKKPIVHARKEAKRRFISGLKKEAINKLIPELPPPDTDLWIVSNGSGAEIRHGIDPLKFDFGSFLPVIVERLGNVNCKVYISTWTANRNHVLTMLDMLDTGQLEKLVVFTDPYFQRREGAIFATLADGILRHSPNAHLLTFKNHAKIIAIANEDETQFCCITGSANLSAQPRVESYVLSTTPDVFFFYRNQFFEELLNDR